MTLIAAFKCSDGVVICADAQETLGVPTPDGFQAYRCRVDKLQPRIDGHYQWVAGGAGDGDLVDGFIERLKDDIAGWEDNLSHSTVKDRLRLSLLDYRRNEVATSGLADDPLDFLICIKRKDGDPFLFIADTSVRVIDDWKMIGWEEGIYRHDIQRHYRQGQSASFAMLVGTHVLQLAKSTSNNIGGPIKIVIGNEAGLRAIGESDVAELEKRVTDFDTTLDALRLRLADASIPLDQFCQHVSDFTTAVEDLRFTLTAEIILANFRRLQAIKTADDLPLLDDILDDPYLRLPSLEEAKQALRVSWEYTVRNRRTLRDCAIACLNLAHAAHLSAEVMRELYKQGILSVDQKYRLAEQLLEIGRYAKSALEQHKDVTVDVFYSDLSEKIAYPLLALADELFDTLFRIPSDDPRADRLVNGLYGGVLSIFTVAFLQHWAEPEPKQLEDGNKNNVASGGGVRH